MSGCFSAPLTLPQWDSGSRKIRFISMVNLTSFRLTLCPKQGGGIPLYLGADVLSNTDIKPENRPRYHAKYAKKGLATKITFSTAVRFQGLKVPTVQSCLWFYSVQGLFRVAFEMYSRIDQLAVLESLQDVWKSQINASPLKMGYSLSRNLDFPEPSPEMSQPKHIEVTTEPTDVGGSDKIDKSADHDYCSSPKHSVQTDEGLIKDQLVLSTIRQKLHSLDETLSSQMSSYTDQLEMIMLLLDSTDRYIKGHLQEQDVTEIVLALLKAKVWGSVYSSSLLSCMGRWLGEQFYAANSCISQKVEDFKVQHIEQISDLPPAEELATQLFPEAMQTLLLHWMGLNEESTLERRRSEYPILLLILEFANHNLITGVAHVLYSSLIYK